jgi:hypothetical protein
MRPPSPYPPSIRLLRWLYRWPRWAKITCLTVLFLLVLTLFPSPLRPPLPRVLGGQASFYFSDLPSQFGVGEIFTVELWAKSGSQPINAVGSTLKFNAKLVEVVSMTTEQSFCTLYTDNTFDNIRGEIMVSCGTPNPGFVGTSPILRANVRAKASGMVTIEMDPKESRILANDGKGTNLVHSYPTLETRINPL